MDLEFFMKPEGLITLLVGISAFATILTVAAPLLQGDQMKARMKSIMTERERLKAVDVCHPGGVRFICPERPERLELFLDRQLRVHLLRLDAGADGVAHPLVHRFRCHPSLRMMSRERATN